jgi:molecular chaperone DnaK
LGDKVPDGDRSSIEVKIEELKQVMNSDDIQKIRQLSEEVQQASYALGQQMYAQQEGPDAGMGGATGFDPTGGAANGGNGRSASDEDVIEGEFTEA